jgi:hypothetical protein
MARLALGDDPAVDDVQRSAPGRPSGSASSAHRRARRGYGERAGEIATNSRTITPAPMTKTKQSTTFSLPESRRRPRAPIARRSCSSGLRWSSLRSYRTIRPADSRKCDSES